MVHALCLCRTKGQSGIGVPAIAKQIVVRGPSAEMANLSRRNQKTETYRAHPGQERLIDQFTRGQRRRHIRIDRRSEIINGAQQDQMHRLGKRRRLRPAGQLRSKDRAPAFASIMTDRFRLCPLRSAVSVGTDTFGGDPFTGDEQDQQADADNDATLD